MDRQRPAAAAALTHVAAAAAAAAAEREGRRGASLVAGVGPAAQGSRRFRGFRHARDGTRGLFAGVQERALRLRRLPRQRVRGVSGAVSDEVQGRGGDDGGGYVYTRRQTGTHGPPQPRERGGGATTRSTRPPGRSRRDGRDGDAMDHLVGRAVDASFVLVLVLVGVVLVVLVLVGLAGEPLDRVGDDLVLDDGANLVVHLHGLLELLHLLRVELGFLVGHLRRGEEVEERLGLLRLGDGLGVLGRALLRLLAEHLDGEVLALLPRDIGALGVLEDRVVHVRHEILLGEHRVLEVIVGLEVELEREADGLLLFLVVLLLVVLVGGNVAEVVLRVAD
mmetsp:Transcript_10972/g.49653  ORF Transcript_10972/g.49653 Transcript_10972/m.49653 type:complete len:336 (-) Transcript_10972:1898-2905(-)